MQPAMGVPMSDFFHFVNGLDAKWEGKFNAQQDKMEEQMKAMREENEKQRIMREYEAIKLVNDNVNSANGKIALASGGVGLIGACITPIPIIGLVGVGMLIASSINGVAHVAINSAGKIEETQDYELGAVIKDNPHCTLEQVKAAQKYYYKWLESYSYCGSDDDSELYRYKQKLKARPWTYDYSPTIKINLRYFPTQKTYS
jgi:hypothetical protein